MAAGTQATGGASSMGEEASGWRLGMTPTGGVRLEVREGEGEVGWAGSFGLTGSRGKEKREGEGGGLGWREKEVFFLFFLTQTPFEQTHF